MTIRSHWECPKCGALLGLEIAECPRCFQIEAWGLRTTDGDVYPHWWPTRELAEVAMECGDERVVRLQVTVVSGEWPEGAVG